MKNALTIGVPFPQSLQFSGQVCSAAPHSRCSGIRADLFLKAPALLGDHSSSDCLGATARPTARPSSHSVPREGCSPRPAREGTASELDQQRRRPVLGRGGAHSGAQEQLCFGTGSGGPRGQEGSATRMQRAEGLGSLSPGQLEGGPERGREDVWGRVTWVSKVLWWATQCGDKKFKSALGGTRLS